MNRPNPDPFQEGSRRSSAPCQFPSWEGLGVGSWFQCATEWPWQLSMNLDIGARLCAQHQPQHAGNIQSAAAGSSTTAALQEIRPGSWSQCMRKKTERGLSMNRPVRAPGLQDVGRVP